MTTDSNPMRIGVALDNAGTELDIRRHAVGQGGVSHSPLTPPVVERVKTLGPKTFRFFVQEYFRMMEAPGRYRWDTIDAMVKSVAATGATPILALCMKPTCLFPVIDQTITAPSNWTHWDNLISDMVAHFVQTESTRVPRIEPATPRRLNGGPEKRGAARTLPDRAGCYPTTSIGPRPATAGVMVRGEQ